MKRFSTLCAILFATTCALAQKADVAFVVGGSFASNTNVVIVGRWRLSPLPSGPILICSWKARSVSGWLMPRRSRFCWKRRWRA